MRVHAPRVLRTHTPGDAPRTPASGPRSVFRLFRGCNKRKKLGGIVKVLKKGNPALPQPVLLYNCEQLDWTT